ncbi:hypothetical protein PsorP6_016971 [Peronosclerospora sorghi]|uniref:Uncharacterized protein n=1 Tax=Peronosclerospora sorghi TaxID=230839 RepID=A0ACC0WBT9_9STRA|nr:hypothetical protein PsorP6_016971 [Peronosclerospora sorghi]
MSRVSSAFGDTFNVRDLCECGSSTSAYWLMLHLVLSFVLVAHVRWSRMTFHNHACHARELPACCQRHLHQETTRQYTKEEVKVGPKKVKHATHAKENEILRPTRSLLPRDERAPDGRLDALRIEYATYLHMLKVGLPRVMVEHKMRAENKDPRVLDELVTTVPKVKKIPAPLDIPTIEAPRTSEERKEKIESFQRMIKVGVPRHVVEMKARREGIGTTELDEPSTLAHLVLEPPSENRVLPPPKLAFHSRRFSTSSAVSTAPSTPDAVATRSALTSNGRDLAMMALRKMNGGMRKKLHWSTMPNDTGTGLLSQRRDSLWSRIHVKGEQERVCISSESRRWMEKLFVKVVANVKRRRVLSVDKEATSQSEPSSQRSEMGKRERSNSNPTLSDDEQEDERDPHDEENVMDNSQSAFLRRKIYVVLLDHKKSQNIAIVLARVKRSFSELAHDILTLNCSVLSSPALQVLTDMWPDSAEQEAIDQYDGDASNLATAEKFLVLVRKVPRVQQKLRCLHFKMDFTLRVDELRENLKLLIRGIRQVYSSDLFAGVLEYIFHLGNLLNFGEGVNYTEWVKGISICSLEKLSYTKAYDGQISFLQYLIQSVERDEPHLALFSDQLPLVFKCSKLSVQSLAAEYQSLRSGLGMLINESQTAAMLETDDVNLRAELEQSREGMRRYVREVEHVLRGVHDLVDELEKERLHFLNYFEEEDTLPIDELLGIIATFSEEYTRERQKLILSARQKTKQNGIAADNPFSRKRHSL